MSLETDRTQHSILVALKALGRDGSRILNEDLSPHPISTFTFGGGVPDVILDAIVREERTDASARAFKFARDDLVEEGFVESRPLPKPNCPRDLRIALWDGRALVFQHGEVDPKDLPSFHFGKLEAAFDRNAKAHGYRYFIGHVQEPNKLDARPQHGSTSGGFTLFRITAKGVRQIEVLEDKLSSADPSKLRDESQPSVTGMDAFYEESVTRERLIAVRDKLLEGVEATHLALMFVLAVIEKPAIDHFTSADCENVYANMRATLPQKLLETNRNLREVMEQARQLWTDDVQTFVQVANPSPTGHPDVVWNNSTFTTYHDAAIEAIVHVVNTFALALQTDDGGIEAELGKFVNPNSLASTWNLREGIKREAANAIARLNLVRDPRVVDGFGTLGGRTDGSGGDRTTDAGGGGTDKTTLHQHELTILSALGKRKSRASQADIERETRLSHSTVHKWLARLEESKLVDRAEGKRSGYALTAKGGDLLSKPGDRDGGVT